MEFIKLMEERDRMCKECGCTVCPIGHVYDDNNDSHLPEHIPCGDLLFQNPKLFEELVEKWSLENPRKSNADVFKEVFGCEINPKDCYGLDCIVGTTCNECPHNMFWSKEYNGEYKK